MMTEPRPEDRDSQEDELESYDDDARAHEPTDTAADEEPMDTGRLHE
jgi:hypothetical protein